MYGVRVMTSFYMCMVIHLVREEIYFILDAYLGSLCSLIGWWEICIPALAYWCPFSPLYINNTVLDGVGFYS
jgi:hypothetical protein